MPSASLLKSFSVFLLTIASFGWAVEVLPAAPPAASHLGDREQAEQFGVELETSRQWLNAIEHYEQAVGQWPESDRLKYGLRRAKFHFSIDRRYSDSSFRNSLLRLSRADATRLFEEVLVKIRSHYVSPISPTSFVAHGTESLFLSLANDRFLETNLAGVDKARIEQLRFVLREQYWNKPVADSREGLHLVDEVCSLASRMVGMPATTVVMEYTFGGCNALDDYSGFLTPARLDDLYDNIDGEFVGLGIEMKSEVGKGLFLVNVLPESPAEDGGISVGEYIVAIDGLDCRYMATDEAAGLLKGPNGSRITLEVADAQSGQRREASLVRREVLVKSFPVVRMLDRQYGIGYISMSGFQKSSAQELDAALADLQRQGMRSLIWDVRGNPGGLLSAAVEVLDRFIDRGVLVSTRGRNQTENYSYSAHAPRTWRIPLVLLTDGDSASASEIVAGAIRDHQRGTIVGTKTYGKWSVQSIFPIDRSTGLRLTTAKFYSPLGHTHGKVGVQPDVPVEMPDAHMTAYRGGKGTPWESDPVIIKGIDILQRKSVPMTGREPEWLQQGRGIAPHMRWSFATDAPLSSMSLGRESGDLVASDMTGGAYRLDRRGQIKALSRGLHGLRKLSWHDDGSGGAAIIGSGLLVRMNPRMDVEWSTELRQDILDIATDPFGYYVAASLADGDVVILDRNKKRVARFHTIRPLSFLRFIGAERGIVGAAEHGLLCRHELDGTPRWSERLWSNVGDLAVTGSGDLNLLAGFNLGIQTFDADGAAHASFVLDGTVKRIAPSDTADRMAAATVESQVYWLDSDGEMLWAAQVDEEIEALACDPLGEWLVCGFQSGRIMRLDWDSAAAA